MMASIIIPTFVSRLDYLKETIISVLDQSISSRDYEVLIVDNSLNTKAREVLDIVKHLSLSNLRYIKESKIGLHHARHAGARVAKGDILVYVDDDVLVHRNWLKALLRPFEDPAVVCTGGKIELKFETAPPSWISEFQGSFLGSLDLAEKRIEIRQSKYLYGCNMAIRKKILFEVGGFNPDGFSDPRLIWLRGDGEIGLLNKVYECGYKVIYEPEAWLYHRVPPERLTLRYFCKREFRGGISFSYTRIRSMRHQRYLFFKLLKYAAFCFYQASIYSIKSRFLSSQKFFRGIKGYSWLGRGQHHLRAACSSALQRYIFQKSYF